MRQKVVSETLDPLNGCQAAALADAAGAAHARRSPRESRAALAADDPVAGEVDEAHQVGGGAEGDDGVVGVHPAALGFAAGTAGGGEGRRGAQSAACQGRVAGEADVGQRDRAGSQIEAAPQRGCRPRRSVGADTGEGRGVIGAHGRVGREGHAGERESSGRGDQEAAALGDRRVRSDIGAVVVGRATGDDQLLEGDLVNWGDSGGRGIDLEDPRRDRLLDGRRRHRRAHQRYVAGDVQVALIGDAFVGAGVGQGERIDGQGQADRVGLAQGGGVGVEQIVGLDHRIPQGETAGGLNKGPGAVDIGSRVKRGVNIVAGRIGHQHREQAAVFQRFEGKADTGPPPGAGRIAMP